MRGTVAIFFFLLLAAPFPAISGVGEAERVFREGNAAFQEDDFQGAIKSYQALLESGYESGKLYYNLGNAHYREGHIARAILNYERAFRRMPTDEDLLHNLEVARLQAVDKIEPVPSLFLWEYFRVLEDHLAISTLTVAAYCCYLICLAGMALFILSRRIRIRKYGLLACASFFLAMCVAISLMTQKISTLEGREHAIVVAEIADVKNAPDDQGPDLFILHAGTKVKILDRVEEWFQIRLEDGKVGWMTVEKLEII